MGLTYHLSNILKVSPTEQYDVFYNFICNKHKGLLLYNLELQSQYQYNYNWYVGEGSSTIYYSLEHQWAQHNLGSDL